MKASDMTTKVMHTCECDEQTAVEYIDSEVDNLRDLLYDDDLRIGDIEQACLNLGLGMDDEMSFIERLMF